VRQQLPDQHQLVNEVKPLLEAGRISWHRKYLKPAWTLLVDLAAT
jgi:hypothetical protein